MLPKTDKVENIPKQDSGITNIYNYLADKEYGKRKAKNIIEQGEEAKVLSKEELLKTGIGTSRCSRASHQNVRGRPMSIYLP